MKNTGSDLPPAFNKVRQRFDISLSRIRKSDSSSPKVVVIEGDASDTKEDLQTDMMSEKALGDMDSACKAGKVMITSSHDAEWPTWMGPVTESKVVDGKFYIKAELDPEHADTHKLVRALEMGKNIGLSIGGWVTDFYHKFDEAHNQIVRVIDGIELDHVMVTGRPANPRTWMAALSKACDPLVEKTKQEDTPMTKEQKLAGAREKTQGIVDSINKSLSDKPKVALLLKEYEVSLKDQKILEDKAEGEAWKEASAETAELAKKVGTSEGGNTMTYTAEELALIEKHRAQQKIDSDPALKAITARLDTLASENADLKKKLTEKGSFGAPAIVLSKEKIAELTDYSKIVKSDSFKNASQQRRIEMLGKSMKEKLATALKGGDSTTTA